MLVVFKRFSFRRRVGQQGTRPPEAIAQLRLCHQLDNIFHGANGKCLLFARQINSHRSLRKGMGCHYVKYAGNEIRL
ncbi:Uncharacterised protein [Shigella sonnei]|nr:Uncharacterised protein [Shigella sonnei]